MKLHFVQVAFAAGCAFAVFFYALTHIDEIKAKQKAATEEAMRIQDVNIDNAKESQRRAIEAAQKKQREDIERIRNMKR